MIAAALILFAAAAFITVCAVVSRRRVALENHITSALAVANTPQVDPRAERFHNYGVTR